MTNCPPDVLEIDDILANAVTDGDVPFVLGAVTDKSGKASFFCQGKDTKTGELIAAGSIFWIASMTKAITSVAALQLVEQRKLDLDAPIGDVLPILRRRDILSGFDAQGQPLLRAARAPITLRHLLTHTSGFAEGTWNARILRYLDVTGHPAPGTGKLAALDLPLLFEPGTSWQYGISHDWVGLAIEAASGKPLDRYLSDHVLSPLGMTNTFHIPDPGQRRRILPVHRREADGSLVPVKRNLPDGREFLSGGGTMFSTAEDYLAFLAMLLSDGRGPHGPVLSQHSIADLAQNHTGEFRVSWIDPAQREMSNAVEFLPEHRKCWGLGAMINLEDIPTGRRAGSIAWAGLGNTYFWADRTAGIGGVLLTQILPFADARVLKLFEAFETACYKRFA